MNSLASPLREPTRFQQQQSTNLRISASGDNWHLNSIAVGDVYFRHRKDALRMMGSASCHSRAASEAFSRGNHVAAKQQSLKAREEWLAAARLNSEAAKQILSIKNRKNDMWKLDLHGLHAKEAVEALKEHLQKMEVHMSSNNLVLALAGGKSMEPKRRTYLLVITGIGKHSRGEPKLPGVVKNFLHENGYEFDDNRPGAIAVWPKFRCRQP